MSEARDLTDSLDALMRRGRDGIDSGGNPMPTPKPRGEVPAQKSSALESPSSGKAGGINSPLTETDYGDREWFTEKTLMTTDGIFAVRLRSLKKMVMTDAKGSAVEMVFKDRP